MVLTPHVGGSTTVALQKVSSSAARNVLTVMRGEPVDPAFQVNPVAFGATRCRGGRTA